MEPNNHEKRVIDLDPYAVTDETLDALESEIRRQTDHDLDTIELFHVFVLDARPDDGLDSHATVFTDASSTTADDTEGGN